MNDKRQVDVMKVLTAIFALIVSAATIFGLYHGLNQYIDARIYAKMSNPSFLKELSRSIRPSVVFDEKQSIVADIGAMTYLEKIVIKKGDNDTLKIFVTPKEYIGIEPVLEALDSAYAIQAERGSGYDWIFQLNSMNLVRQEGPNPDETRPQRFRLELIR
jgi:hypothetical protein